MNKPNTCTRQGHDTLEEYRTHRQQCNRCRTEMAELNAIAKRQTDEDIAAIDRRIEDEQ